MGSTAKSFIDSRLLTSFLALITFPSFVDKRHGQRPLSLRYQFYRPHLSFFKQPSQSFPKLPLLFKDTTVVMRFSRVLATATSLLPALSSLASAAYLPTATRSVNPLLDPRDLSVEAHVCADLDTKISVFVLDIVEVDIDLHICLCVDAVVEYVNSRSDIPDDCRADASRKITNKVSFVFLSLVFSFYLFTDWSATFHCLDQKPPFCRSVPLPSQLQTYLAHMLHVKKMRLRMRTWLHQEPYHR